MFKNFRTEEIREEVIYLPLLDACLREVPPCGTKAGERGRVRPGMGDLGNTKKTSIDN